MWGRGLRAPDSAIDTRRLIYRLSHKYTQANLSFEQLKGSDRIRAKALNSAAASTGFLVYLCNLEKFVSGGTGDVRPYRGYRKWGWYDDDSDEEGHHDIDDVIDESLELTYVATLAGEPFANRLLLNEDAEIVQEDAFERDTDSEELDGYTGNEGATATHIFRDTIGYSLAHVVRTRADYQAGIANRTKGGHALSAHG